MINIFYWSILLALIILPIFGIGLIYSGYPGWATLVGLLWVFDGMWIQSQTEDENTGWGDWPPSAT